MGLLAAIGSLLTLAACGSGSSDWSGETFPPYRYKLTAEVETPQGARSGSSVIQVQWFTKPKALGPMGGGGFQVTGEAAAVDVAPGQTLFVLLNSRTDPDWPAYAAGVFGQVADMTDVSRDPQQLWYPKGDPRGKGEPNIPYLVRFRDIRNPMSIEEVDPDDLQKSFGAGIKLKTLNLQITDHPVTRYVEQRLKWLSIVKGKNLDGSSTSRPNAPLASSIGSGGFLRGF